MRHPYRVSFACLTLLIAASVGGTSLVAAPNRPGVIVSPTTIGCPLEASNPMRVCVTGFAQGDVVVVAVPWMGSPDSFSVLSFQNSIDATGRWCFNAPESWTTLDLAPGAYSVKVSYYPRNNNSRLRTGPSTILNVE